jgi:hypothetical protein
MVAGQLTFLDNAVQDATGQVSLRRDDSQSGASILAWTLCQYSARPQYDQERCTRPRNRAADVSPGFVCLCH